MTNPDTINLIFILAFIVFVLFGIQCMLTTWLLIDIKIKQIKDRIRIRKENKIYKNIVNKMKFQ